MLESWKSQEGPKGQEGPEGSADLKGPDVLKAMMDQKENSCYMFGNFDQLPKVNIFVCASVTQRSVRNEVWSASIAKIIRYVLSEVHKYRWVGRHKGGGRSLCYLFQPVCIQRSASFGHTMAFSMLFTGLTAYYKNRLRAPLIQI